MREPRVRRVIEPLLAGNALPPDLLDDDLRFTIAAVLDALRIAAENHLPGPLLPPEADPSTPAESRLLDLLTRWSRQCPRPVVLFLDEIDALVDDVLISGGKGKSGVPPGGTNPLQG